MPDENPSRPDSAALRRGVLAASVLDDIDVEPRDDAVLLPGDTPVRVPWADLAAAVGGCEPASPVGRARIGSLLRLLRVVGDLGPAAPAALRAGAVPLALPRGHALHPGPSWVQARVPGGVLDLGVGVRVDADHGPAGVDGQDGARQAPADLALVGPVEPLPDAVARACGARPADWWPDLQARAEEMGALTAGRLARDGGEARGHDVLRPVGGCDVLTLLSSGALRSALASFDGAGMRAVAVPVRHRGWVDLARIDPAYVATVWELTDELERGVPTPLLVTRDEVCLPAPGGDVTRHAI